jgi:integrase
MAAVLAAIRVLLDWAQRRDIDLEKRFAHQQFLTEQELESLYFYTQLRTVEPDIRNPKVVRLPRGRERARRTHKPREDRVSSVTQYIRMSYVADYLKWLAIRLVEREAEHVDTRVMERFNRMLESFRARRPQKSQGSGISARMGLTEDQQLLLLHMVEPESPRNPFSPEVHVRNRLIVLLLYHLGLREGELLALRIPDFDFQQNTVLVARRHDSPNDPRTYQPVVKTRDRRIPLAEPLITIVSNYVLQDRCRFLAAKRHDFLFITHKAGPFEGQPLSIKGLAKVFSEIQGEAPNELGGLTAHSLRHTANDRFSELMDHKGTSQAEEEKMRSYLMGWKEGSGTAATYTRRHVQKKAMEAALKLQEKVANNRRDNND